MPLLCYEHEAWDFGLVGDSTPYNGVIAWDEGLQKRLEERYEAMEELDSLTAELKRDTTAIDMLKRRL